MPNSLLEFQFVFVQPYFHGKDEEKFAILWCSKNLFMIGAVAFQWEKKYKIELIFLQFRRKVFPATKGKEIFLFFLESGKSYGTYFFVNAIQTCSKLDSAMSTSHLSCIHVGSAYGFGSGTFECHLNNPFGSKYNETTAKQTKYIHLGSTFAQAM